MKYFIAAAILVACSANVQAAFVDYNTNQWSNNFHHQWTQNLWNNHDWLKDWMQDHFGCRRKFECVGDKDITPAPTPIPAAIWLFGAAIFGMAIIGRRTSKQS